MATLEQCELMTLKLGRIGAFVDMSYRLFPETRNSFTPDFIELGFEIEEIQRITRGAELRFQIFPTEIVGPLKKQLEDLRAVLRGLDRGPFKYTGHPFLDHEQIRRFHMLANETREAIRGQLKSELLDNYDRLRAQAFDDLRETLATLLPRLGIENTRQILSDPNWFDAVFPAQKSLTGDFRLDVHLHNAHPVALMDNAVLLRQIGAFLDQPRQLSLFRR